MSAFFIHYFSRSLVEQRVVLLIKKTVVHDVVQLSIYIKFVESRHTYIIQAICVSLGTHNDTLVLHVIIMMMTVTERR